MDFNGIISVNKAIVHIIDQENNVHKLSDFEIVINENLSALIIKHINESIKHDARRYAEFKNDESTVRKSCVKILEDNNSFVQESKKISRELYKSMKTTNASSANLLVALYKHGEQSAIAILKLDFDDSFRTEEKVEEGKTKIEIKVDGTAFNKRQKLQKCAFIYDSILDGKNTKIVILDKQTTGEVSNYFGSTFLDCDLVNDYKSNTKKMLNEIVGFINDKYADDPKEQLEKTFSLTNVFEKNDKFVLESAMNKLFDDEETKNEFKSKIENKEIDYEFHIDKPRVLKQLNRTTLITGNGLSLRGKASLFNSNDISFSEKYEDGSVDIIIRKVKIMKSKL